MESGVGQNSSYSFNWVDWVLLMATLVLSLGIGLFQALKGGKQRTTDEYLMADRKMRIFPVAVSLVVSFISGIYLIGIPAEIYYYGIEHFVGVLGAGCGIVIGALCYVPLFYPLRMTSINEYLQKRFQSRVVVLVGWFCQILYQVVYIGIVLYAASVMMEEMVGIPVWASILVVGLVGTVYTTLGGLKAVIWTDVFQAAVILGGLITVLVKGIYLTGGLGEVWHQYSKEGRAKVDYSASLYRRQTVFNTFFNGVYMYVMFTTATQTALQRFASVPSLSAAKRTLLVSLLPLFAIQLICCSCGVVAFSYFAEQGCEPFAAGYITSPNQIVPYFVKEVLHYPGIPGVFVACVMCGSLSNLSSSLNAITASTWSDLLSDKLSKLSDVRKTTITKIMTAVFGLISLGLCYIIALFEGTIVHCTGVPLLLLFTLGGLVPRLNSKSLLVAVFVGISVALFFGVGSMTIKAHQTVSTGDIVGCSRNETYTTMKPTTAELDMTTESSFSTDTSDWKKIFEISHFWFGICAFLFGSVIGMIATVIPGCHAVGKRTPDLYFRCIGRCIKNRKESNGGGEKDVEKCEISSVGNPTDSF